MILYFFILWFICADRASWVGSWARTAQAAPAVQIHSWVLWDMRKAAAKGHSGCSDPAEHFCVSQAATATGVIWSSIQMGEGGCSMQNAQSPGLWQGDSTQPVFMEVHLFTPHLFLSLVLLLWNSSFRRLPVSYVAAEPSPSRQQNWIWVRKASFGLLWLLQPSEG